MRSITRGIKYALKAASFSRVQGRNMVGAAIIKGKVLISLGWNSDKTHPASTTRYHAHHAEFSCLIGTKKSDVSGAILYVARITKRGKLGISKPCSECETVIRASGIKRVYYLDAYGNPTLMKM